MSQQRLTQADLANAASISPNRASKVLRGAAPINISELSAMASRLGLSVADVIQEAGELSDEQPDASRGDGRGGVRQTQRQRAQQPA